MYHSGTQRYGTSMACRCRSLILTWTQTGELIQNVFVHDADLQVTDLQWSSDRTYFITASKDKTAKVGFLHLDRNTL